MTADTSWWVGVERGDPWRRALKAQYDRLITSQFGKSHRLATGPNTVAEEAGEAKRRRSRLELVSEMDARQIRRAS